MYVSNNRTFIKPYQWIAKVLGLQVKEIYRRVFGEKHPDTVLSSYGLAAIRGKPRFCIGRYCRFVLRYLAKNIRKPWDLCQDWQRHTTV
jgi:hypothetical protein